MAKDYKEQLKEHIEALENQYVSIINLLNDPLDTDEESGKIKLKDSQRKVYAEGVLKIVETADSIIERIGIKKEELNKLNNTVESPKLNKDQEVVQQTSHSNLGNRLK